MEQSEAERRTILRVVVGSTAHGLNLAGTDDRDEMGIVIESMADALSLGQPFEQFIYRSAAERDGRHDAPSQAGDLDLVLYSLRKFCRLAAQGNPTVLIPLFAPHDQHVSCYCLGHQLQEMAPLFVSREAGARFLGYMHAQRQRLLGERGQKRVKRPELEAAHGYDTKYAVHMLRLGFQGLELLGTGHMSLPMREPERAFLMDVRRGQVPFNDVIQKVGDLEADLRAAIESSPLPEHPAREAIETWMQRVYLENWKAADVQIQIAAFGGPPHVR